MCFDLFFWRITNIFSLNFHLRRKVADTSLIVGSLYEFFPWKEQFLQEKFISFTNYIVKLTTACLGGCVTTVFHFQSRGRFKWTEKDRQCSHFYGQGTQTSLFLHCDTHTSRTPAKKVFKKGRIEDGRYCISELRSGIVRGPNVVSDCTYPLLSPEVYL